MFVANLDILLINADTEKGDHKPPKANLVDGEDIIAAVVVSQANMVAAEGKKEWVIDSGATKTHL